MLRSIVGLPALALFALSLNACKTGGTAGLQDVTLSPTDTSKPIGVLWQTSDNNVHFGVCPPAVNVDRNCQGLKETAKPIPFNEYSNKLMMAIITARPGAANSATTSAQVNKLQEKIDRLEAKIKAGGLSTTEQTSFDTQVKQLKSDLQKIVALTTSEQANFDSIVNSLQSGKDVALDEGEENYTLAVLPFGGIGRVSSLPLPPPGTNNNRIDIQTFVDAWNEEADFFYGSNKGYTKGTPVGIMSEPITSCINACPAYYSTLTCHFYCWHPSYQQVVPNVRGCFTSIVRDRLVNKPNGQPLNLYPEVFDYCMYQEYDQVLRSIPAYDENMIKQRKASGDPADRKGVLKYMTQKQEDAFKYIMFNWYNPFAFDLTDQQAVLDKFYQAHPAAASVPHTATISGKSNHPNFTQLVAYMQSLNLSTASSGSTSSTGGSTGTTGSGTATSCPASGKLVDGNCWYQGAVGESCTKLCARNSLTVSNATTTYAGSSGTDANCVKVSAAFGVTNTFASYQGAGYGCALCNGSCGTPITNSVFRAAGLTDPNTSSTFVQPFCACQ